LENISNEFPISYIDQDLKKDMSKRFKGNKNFIKSCKKKSNKIEEKISNLQNDFKKKFCNFACKNYKHVLMR
jgi:chaperonin cofactor prefoldin